MMALYYNKEKKILKIEKESRVMYSEKHLKEIEECGISSFNDCYFISLERKPLVLKAKELREQWIEKVKEELIELENMSYPKR